MADSALPCWGPLAKEVATAGIREALARYRWDDAIFIAERLNVEAETVESIFLLATCYYRSGRKQQSRHLLMAETASSPECDLLYARCCLELGDSHAGLARLGGLLCAGPGFSEDDIISRYGSTQLTAEAFWLLGRLNKELHQVKEACRHYRLSLKHNPLMWSAYQELCAMACCPASPDEVFTVSQQQQLPTGLMPPVASPAALQPNTKKTSPLDRLCYITPDMLSNPPPGGLLGKAMASSTPVLVDPSRPAAAADTSSSLGTDCPQQTLSFTPSPSTDTLAHSKSRLPPSIARCSHQAPQQQQDQQYITPHQQQQQQQDMPPPSTGPQLRRSARLGRGGGASGRPVRESSSNIAARKRRFKSPVGKGTAKGPTKKQRVTFTPSLSSSNRPIPSSCRKTLLLQDSENVPVGGATPSDDKMQDKMDTTVEGRLHHEDHILVLAMKEVLSLFKLMAAGYHCLQQYQLTQAVTMFRSLPRRHYNTAWVLTCTAQAFIAGERFREATQLFEVVHKMDPHRQEGKEQYGAALWHLHRETQLSLLVEDLHSSNHCTPQAMCTMASLMNLYKDHDAAIKFLQRAIQINAQFCYAHSLLGLEYTLTKHYDKALQSFQSAVTIDPRHYNAWYGMAYLYSQQEKFKLAEVCSRRALAINGGSSVAMTQLAIVLQQQGRLEEALATADLATSMNTSNHLPQYHRASILSGLGRNEEALKQLEQVTSSLPREPSFYRAMGNLLIKLGRPHDAVLQMAWARDYRYSSGCDDGSVALLSLDNMEQFNDDDFVPHSDNED